MNTEHGTNPIVELNQVTKFYGEVVGCNDISATIGTGITGLLGHNGAGKTTLLSLITGQLKPTMGTVRVFSERPWNNPRVLSRIGYCPEGVAFWHGIRGIDFVTFMGTLSGYTRRAARKAAERVLDRVGMTPYLRKRMAEYSRGMQQRAKIAQALVHNPDLLVLDEPLAGMDPVGRSDLVQLFRDLAAQGTSIIISSHILYEVQTLTNDVLFMDHGRLGAQGALQEIRRMMSERAHTLTMATPACRQLAALLIGRPTVSGVEVVRERNELTVRTHDPETLATELPGLLVDHDIVCTEITSPDDSLESLFGYLTERPR